MMKTPRREESLRALFSLIEQYETPPERDASTDEGASWWSAWAEDLNALAARCQSDNLMLYLLAAYTDYMCDAGKALAETGHGLKWNGQTTEVILHLKNDEKAEKADEEGGWIG